MGDLRAAITFLTRVRAGAVIVTPDRIARGVPWFPVVGALVGLAVGGVYAVGREVFPPLLAATVAVAVGVWVTGAFHEDGLADLADAVGSGRTGEDALAVMRDPTLGTFGVSAIVLSVGVRIAAVSSMSARAALVVVPAAHAAARGAALMLLLRRRRAETDGAAPVTADGLGASYASVVTARQVGAAAAAGLVIACVAIGPLLGAAASVLALAASWLVGREASRRVGDITGDALGAAEQVAEAVVLLSGVAAALHAWLAVPWWC